MANPFAGKPIPSYIAALPFLFTRPQTDDLGWHCRSALAAAVAAERACDLPRNTRGRIAYVLCELGYQLARRGCDAGADLPISRADLARLLDVGLSRVKRVLALLQLSQVIEADGQRIRITDWARLCGVAGYDPRRLDLTPAEEELLPPSPSEVVPQQLTAGGDQACFV
jgi:hypothetical protein